MADAPAFQFYAADFLADENQMVMELAEAGAYIRLMCVCWREGSIPADLRKLAKLVGATRSEMEEMWPALEACFEPMVAEPQPGHSQAEARLVHPRLEREREKQESYRKRMQEAGKKGAKARHGGRKSQKRDSRKPQEPQQDPSQAKAEPQPGHSQALARAGQALHASSSSSGRKAIKPPAYPDVPGGREREVDSRPGGEERHGPRTRRELDREVILRVWHLGRETVQIDGKPVSMALELKIRDDLVATYGEEDVHRALPWIRVAEEFPPDEPVSLRLPEARPEVMSRMLGAANKHASPAPGLPDVEVKSPPNPSAADAEGRRMALKQIELARRESA